MMQLIYYMLQFPLPVRVLIFLSVVLACWWLLGKPLTYCLSIIPFLLRKIFLVFYRIIELPITFLHKNVGSVFYTLDNFMAEMGLFVDGVLEKCYKYLHTDYKFKAGFCFILALICYAFIVIPSYVHIDIEALNIGRNMYEESENKLSEIVLKYVSEHIQTDGSINTEETDSGIKLIVQGVNSSLYVRDIPNKRDGIALDYLYNGDQVIWTGELVFADWSNGKKIALVKVITANNVEGWSRLDYLYPEGYEVMTFELENTLD